MISSVSPPRMWWAGDETGWVIDVQHVLSREMVQRCVAYTLRTQEQRLHALTPGSLRDECLRTIAALKQGRVRQNIVGTGDHVLFGAEQEHERKLFIPGAKS